MDGMVILVTIVLSHRETIYSVYTSTIYSISILYLDIASSKSHPLDVMSSRLDFFFIIFDFKIRTPPKFRGIREKITTNSLIINFDEMMVNHHMAKNRSLLMDQSCWWINLVDHSLWRNSAATPAKKPSKPRSCHECSSTNQTTFSFPVRKGINLLLIKGSICSSDVATWYVTWNVTWYVTWYDPNTDCTYIIYSLVPRTSSSWSLSLDEFTQRINRFNLWWL